jgi:predicted DNA binding CopG/RHH family protein
MNKKIPPLHTDAAAEALLKQDLTGYLDLSTWQRVNFEVLPKTKVINMRFPQPLYAAVKKMAAEKGISYQRYIRQAVENSLYPPR